MKALSVIIKLIDNTKRGSFIDEGFANGYSQYNKQTKPNCGKVLYPFEEFNPDDIVYFYEMGDVYLPSINAISVPPSSIFLCNGLLRKDNCVVVDKHTVNQSFSFMNIRNQEFFKVVQSTIDPIHADDLIVIRSQGCHRFNYGKREYFVVQQQAIEFYFSVNLGEIKPGPCYQFIKQVNRSELLLRNKQYNNRGKINNKTTLFEDYIGKVELSGQYYYIVPKEDIYATM
jgi:hypothetical protein